MKVKTIQVTYGRKVNLGNYNSAEIGLSIWADLDQGEDPDAAIASLQVDAMRHVRDEYQRLRAQVKSPVNGTLSE